MPQRAVSRGHHRPHRARACSSGPDGPPADAERRARAAERALRARARPSGDAPAAAPRRGASPIPARARARLAPRPAIGRVGASFVEKQLQRGSAVARPRPGAGASASASTTSMVTPRSFASARSRAGLHVRPRAAAYITLCSAGPAAPVLARHICRSPVTHRPSRRGCIATVGARTQDRAHHRLYRWTVRDPGDLIGARNESQLGWLHK